MNSICSIVRNKRKEAMINTKIASLDDNFKVIVETESNKNGKFNLLAEAVPYPYFISVTNIYGEYRVPVLFF